MALRVAFFALMALGLLGLGFVAYAATRPVAAVNNAPPPPAVPGSATMDTEDERRGLVGAMVRRSLGAGELIRAADALRPGDHGFLAAVLKGDMRAVTVGVDAM